MPVCNIFSFFGVVSDAEKQWIIVLHQESEVNIFLFTVFYYSVLIFVKLLRIVCMYVDKLFLSDVC